MREILFKAKRVDNGEWIEGNYYASSTRTIHFIRDYRGHDHEIIPETVSQFTGVIDKKREMIFEGDILTGVGVVEWKSSIQNCGCCFSVNASGFDFETRPERLEIIGNIHDNKK